MIFKETEEITHKTHTPRNSYINEAIKFYNRLIKRKLLKKRYQKESALVAGYSLEINREFQDIENENAL